MVCRPCKLPCGELHYQGYDVTIEAEVFQGLDPLGDTTEPTTQRRKFLPQGIDFMGPFPSSKGNKYILVAFDYLSKCVEAKALPTNDARVVVKFLKTLFSRFGTPKAIISDRGTHFFNDQFSRVTEKYRVTHRLSTAYHPQTSGQVEVTNRGLKRILERTVGENHASWSDKLEDALWAFRTTFKTFVGCTPYRLVYGKAYSLHVEVQDVIAHGISVNTIVSYSFTAIEDIANDASVEDAKVENYQVDESEVHEAVVSEPQVDEVHVDDA
nr:reverse transcriptase domain-containing protein [Tanacetum cinerariifolium]